MRPNINYYLSNLKDETFVELRITCPLARLGLHLSACIRQQANSVHIILKLEMWANAQRDGGPAEYMWRPLFNTANFG